MGTPALRLVRPPSRVVLTTTDSNTWGGHSGYIYTFPRLPNGATDIDVVVVREGKNFKGRMLGIVLGLFGKRVLGKALGTTVNRSPELRRENSGPDVALDAALVAMFLAGPIRKTRVLARAVTGATRPRRRRFLCHDQHPPHPSDRRRSDVPEEG